MDQITPPKTIAIVSFVDSKVDPAFRGELFHHYVYPKDITWKEMQQEIADLREHYEEVRLLENFDIAAFGSDR